jgi:hypothetical protein
MKYLILSAVAAFFLGATGIANAQGVSDYRPSTHRGSGCSSNPYSPGHVLGCDTGASAKKKNALTTKHSTKHPKKPSQ